MSRKCPGVSCPAVPTHTTHHKQDAHWHTNWGGSCGSDAQPRGHRSDLPRARAGSCWGTHCPRAHHADPSEQHGQAAPDGLGVVSRGAAEGHQGLPPLPSCVTGAVRQGGRWHHTRCRDSEPPAPCCPKQCWESCPQRPGWAARWIHGIPAAPGHDAALLGGRILLGPGLSFRSSQSNILPNRVANPRATRQLPSPSGHDTRTRRE